MEAGLYVGQLLLLPADLAAAAVAASSAAVAAALAGLPVSGAQAAVGATKRLSDEQFELFLEVGAEGVVLQRDDEETVPCSLVKCNCSG